MNPDIRMMRGKARSNEWGYLAYRYTNAAGKNCTIAPSDLDGLTERNRDFLVLEVKRGEENFSNGQVWMLRKLSLVPRFTVVVVYSEHEIDPVTDSLLVVPSSFAVFKNGELSEKIVTDPVDFAKRYGVWCGHQPGWETAWDV